MIKIYSVFILFSLFINSAYTQEKLDPSAILSSDSEFDKLVKRLDYNPDDILAGDRIRELCRAIKDNIKCIDILNELVEKHPKNKNIRYQAALAYVDEVPGHTLFKKGWYSTRSISHMSEVLVHAPEDWGAYYIRGLNSIYWPKSFRRLGRAISDLEQCLVISDKLPKGLVRPYHILAYIALGDAYVKSGEIEKAISIYQKGVQLRESSQLSKRLSMSRNELSAFVEKFRDSDTQVDTNISFLLDGGADKI